MYLVCGVDEAGRGPLAGPVYAAAVILDPARPIVGLADSKKLSERARERLALEIREKVLSFGIASASVEEIEPAISAASILAKTARDAEMRRIHEAFPQYGLDRHKGYDTAIHRAALLLHGPAAFHRRSFAPVRALLEGSR